MSSRYDVWYNRQTDEHDTFRNMQEAVNMGARGPYLVTERIPLGDPRLFLIEAIARGETNAPYSLVVQASDAIQEAKRFDFYRGRDTSHHHVEREAEEEESWPKLFG